MIDPETLKLLNLLSPGGNDSNPPMGMPPQTGQQPSMIQPFDTGDNQLMQMLNPRDTQFEQLVGMINQIPQRQDYQPSRLRRIAGFAAGLGAGGPVGIAGGQPIGYKADVPSGLKIQSAITDEPYNKAVQDWMLKEGPTLESAKLENAKNVNMRIGASNIRTAQLREEGLQRQRNWDATRATDLEEKRKQAEEKIEISRQRAAAYKYDKEHPNHVYKEDKDGNVYGIDPKTNSVEYLFDDDGNYIKSKNLSDEMKLKIKHEDTMSEIGARGNEARKTEVVRQTGRENLEDKKNDNKTGARTGKKPETAANKHIRLFDNAVEAVNKHPDWADYITFDRAHKVFNVKTPETEPSFYEKIMGKEGKKGDPKIAQQILDFIYGDDAEKPKISTKKSEGIRPTTREDGKTHVKRKSDGQVGWVTDPDMTKYELIP